MNDQILVGVIAGLSAITGAIVGSVPGYFVLKAESDRWKKDKKISLLKEKKQETIQKFYKIERDLREGALKNSFSIDSLSDSVIYFPISVREVIDKFIFEKDPNKRRMLNVSFHAEAKKYIKSLDSEIDKLLS